MDYNTQNAGGVTSSELHGSGVADVDGDGIRNFIVWQAAVFASRWTVETRSLWGLRFFTGIRPFVIRTRQGGQG